MKFFSKHSIYKRAAIFGLFMCLAWIPFSDTVAQSEIQKWEARANELAGQIERLQIEGDSLRTVIAFIRRAIAGTGGNGNEFTERGGPVIPELSGLNNRIEELKNERNNLKYNNSKLRNDLAEREEKIRQQQAENQRLLAEIERLKKLVGTLEFRVDSLNQITTCIAEFQDERRSARLEAQAKLAEANADYEYYYNHKNDRSVPQAKKDSLVRNAYEIYSLYGADEREKDCYGINQSYYDDYMTGLEHYYLSRMIAYNDGNIVNGLGSTLGEKLNTMNELLLSNLGAAVRKGVYNNRSDAEDIIEELPIIIEQLGYFLVTERKGNDESVVQQSEDNGAAPIPSPSGGETRTKIATIGASFDRGDYATAISLFNKYNRFFELDELKDKVDLIANAKYCAGTILLWDLADISNYKGLMPRGSWLSNNIKSRDEIGRKLLVDFKDNEKVSPVLRKKAYVILNKQYQKK